MYYKVKNTKLNMPEIICFRLNVWHHKHHHSDTQVWIFLRRYIYLWNDRKIYLEIAYSFTKSSIIKNVSRGCIWKSNPPSSPHFGISCMNVWFSRSKTVVFHIKKHDSIKWSIDLFIPISRKHNQLSTFYGYFLKEWEEWKLNSRPYLREGENNVYQPAILVFSFWKSWIRKFLII